MLQIIEQDPGSTHFHRFDTTAHALGRDLSEVDTYGLYMSNIEFEQLVMGSVSLELLEFGYDLSQDSQEEFRKQFPSHVGSEIEWRWPFTSGEDNVERLRDVYLSELKAYDYGIELPTRRKPDRWDEIVSVGRLITSNRYFLEEIAVPSGESNPRRAFINGTRRWLKGMKQHGWSFAGAITTSEQGQELRLHAFEVPEEYAGVLHTARDPEKR